MHSPWTRDEQSLADKRFCNINNMHQDPGCGHAEVQVIHEHAPGTLTEALSVAINTFCQDEVSDHGSRCCTSMDLHRKGRTTGATHPVAARDEDQGESHHRSPLIPFPHRMPSIAAGIGKLVWPHDFKLQFAHRSRSTYSTFTCAKECLVYSRSEPDDNELNRNWTEAGQKCHYSLHSFSTPAGAHGRASQSGVPPGSYIGEVCTFMDRVTLPHQQCFLTPGQGPWLTLCHNLSRGCDAETSVQDQGGAGRVYVINNDSSSMHQSTGVTVSDFRNIRRYGPMFGCSNTSGLPSNGVVAVCAFVTDACSPAHSNSLSFGRILYKSMNRGSIDRECRDSWTDEL